MVSIEKAYQNIQQVPYTNIEYIQELELLNNLLPVLSQGSVGNITEIDKNIQKFTNSSNNNENITFNPVTKQTSSFDSILNPQNISPFDLLNMQLSEENQINLQKKMYILRLNTKALLYVFSSYFTLTSKNKTIIYFQIKKFLESHQNFLTDSSMRIIIKLFLLNNEKDLKIFRSKIINVIKNSQFINFCFPGMKGQESSDIIHHLFKSILGLSTTISINDLKVQLYLRYVIQFINAPFMNEYKELKSILSISNVLKQDIKVFVNNSYIDEFRQQKQLSTNFFGFNF